MKNGIFIIIQENGKLIAAIKRADNQIMRLDNLIVTDAIKAFDGKKCEYLPKTTIVLVDGKNVYEIKSVLMPVPTPIKKESRTKLTDSFKLTKAQVPQDVRDLGFTNHSVENFYLKLNHFARFEDVKGDLKFYFFNAKEREEKDKITHQKRILLDKFEIHESYGSTDFTVIVARALKNAKYLVEKVEIFIFEPQWRLIVGLGGASVYETSMTLHHIYGFPYIPASSIKGVLRNYIINECFNFTDEERAKWAENESKKIDWNKLKEEKAFKCLNFKRIFGSQEDKGKVIFFDAFPTKAPKIVVDIMTPHYGDYYSDKTGKVAPTDTQSPNPIPFLTVEDTPFQFLLGSKDIVDIQTEKLWNDKTLVEWLKAALTEHGIGAKTAVGYGYFKV